MGQTKSRYDFVAKIADFGLFSHVRDSNARSSDAMGLDNHGNQMYSAFAFGLSRLGMFAVANDLSVQVPQSAAITGFTNEKAPIGSSLGQTSSRWALS